MGEMSEVSVEEPSSVEDAPPVEESGADDQRVELLGTLSAGLAVLSFLTLLRLADRRDRTPLRALGLFFATTTESITATALGATAVTQREDADQLSRGFVLGAAGALLGIITTLLNFTWLRTRRRI